MPTIEEIESGRGSRDVSEQHFGSARSVGASSAHDRSQRAESRESSRTVQLAEAEASRLLRAQVAAGSRRPSVAASERSVRADRPAASDDGAGAGLDVPIPESARPERGSAPLVVPKIMMRSPSDSRSDRSKRGTSEQRSSTTELAAKRASEAAKAARSPSRVALRSLRSAPAGLPAVPEGDDHTTPGEKELAADRSRVKTPAGPAGPGTTPSTAPPKGLPPVVPPTGTIPPLQAAAWAQEIADGTRRMAEMSIDTDRRDAVTEELRLKYEEKQKCDAAFYEASLQRDADERHARLQEYQTVEARVRHFEALRAGGVPEGAFKKEETAPPDRASQRAESPCSLEGRLSALKDGQDSRAPPTIPVSQMVMELVKEVAEERKLLLKLAKPGSGPPDPDGDPDGDGDGEDGDPDAVKYYRRTGPCKSRLGNQIAAVPELKDMKKSTTIKVRLTHLAKYDRDLKFWLEGAYEAGAEMFDEAKRLATILASDYVKSHKQLAVRASWNFTCAEWSSTKIYKEDNSVLASVIPKFLLKLPDCVTKAFQAAMVSAQFIGYDVRGFHRFVALLYEIRVQYGAQEPDDYERLAKALEEINSQIRGAVGKEWAEVLDQWWGTLIEVRDLYPNAIVWKRVGKSLFKVYKTIIDVLSMYELKKFVDEYDKQAQLCDGDEDVTETEVTALGTVLRGYCRTSADVLQAGSVKTSRPVVPPPFALAAVSGKGKGKGKGRDGKGKGRKGKGDQSANQAATDAAPAQTPKETPTPPAANAAKEKGGGDNARGGRGKQKGRGRGRGGGAPKGGDPTSKYPCHNMQRDGKCDFGDRCKYNHDIASFPK